MILNEQLKKLDAPSMGRRAGDYCANCADAREHANNLDSAANSVRRSNDAGQHNAADYSTIRTNARADAPRNA